MAPTIVLEVEGVLFKTSLSTLTSVKGSYFNRIFQRDWKDRLDRRGHLFIDRDSTIFPLILNYLRDGIVWTPARQEMADNRCNMPYYLLSSMFEGAEPGKTRSAGCCSQLLS
ncbi:unnamed protein product [Cylicocyclus nassatus]|uniref:BTB domain-containing protein n=1 Tax=Cylicocyclus nassatus TaxID=53992 RepID=A0AA36M4U5_CYLNA|nr:unnamed protein product [Cylicocyclus nassatus]